MMICLCAPGVSRASAGVGEFKIKNLRASKNGADYIVITPKQFLRALEPLLRKRAAGGLRVAAVTPEQIYKTFDRWPAGPKAIRAFIRYAYYNWQAPAPRYVLLNGDINIYEKYDPEGVMMPTFLVRMIDGGKTASDNPFADMDGDEIPEIAVGRFPVDTAEELDAVIAKIIAYETNPPPGPWRRRISVFASTGGFGAMDSTLEEITKRIVRANFDPLLDINMTYGGSNLPYFLLPKEFSPKIIERFNEGALVMNYIGHGGITGLTSVCWKNECAGILEMEDIPKIHTAGKNPFFFSTCCLTGTYNIGIDCIAEELFKSPEGPIGVFAASMESSPYSNAILSKEILHFLVVKRPATIGEALVNIKRGLAQRFDDDRKMMDKTYEAYAGKDAARSDTYDHLYKYNYIGDPATRIPYPAENITITAPQQARAGETFTASIQSTDKLPGRLLVTLECNPVEIIHHITDIETVSEDALAETVRKNYAGANDKAAVRIETTLGPDGVAKVDIDIPGDLPAGEYYVKAYAYDGTPDAAGIANIIIENDNRQPAAEKHPATAEIGPEKDSNKAKEATQPGRNALLQIIGQLAEPEITDADIEAAKNILGTGPGGGEPTTPPPPTIEELESRVKEKPTDAQALLDLANAYLDDRQINKLDDALDALLQLSPGAEILESVAVIYMPLYRYDAALNVLQKAAAMDDKRTRTRTMIANVYSTTGRHEQAVTILKDFIAATGGDNDAYYTLAQTYAYMGKVDEAEKIYRTLLENTQDGYSIPESSYYFYRYQVHDPEKAEEIARKIIENKGGYNWLYTMTELAELLIERNPENLKEPMELMWKFYKLKQSKYPKAMALASVGELLLRNRRDAQSYDLLLKQALEIAPQCAECLTIHWNWRDTHTALENCERASQIDPEYTEALQCIASKIYWQGNFTEAIQYYEKIRAMGEQPMSPEEEIRAYNNAGNHDKALELLAAAKNFRAYYTGDRDANDRISKMILYFDIGEMDAAENEYQQYLEKYPEGVMMYHYYARELMYGNQLDRAVELEEAAIQNNPYCAECLKTLGDLNVRLKRWHAAEDALSRALPLLSRDNEVKSMLGQAYFNNGKKDDARKLFLEVLEVDGWNSAAGDGLKALIDPDIYFD